MLSGVERKLNRACVGPSVTVAARSRLTSSIGIIGVEQQHRADDGQLQQAPLHRAQTVGEIGSTRFPTVGPTTSRCTARLCQSAPNDAAAEVLGRAPQ